MPITRHFATVEDQSGLGRQVHYRRAGNGPPVILLHMSPRSSAEFEPLMAAWADRFTVIAPDTPGYGASDPLQGGPFALSAFADALAAFADAIGLERFGVYGHHTGAMIAAEFARLYPGRVTMTVANGYLIVRDDERQEILDNYFADFTPQPDGRHLAHIWRRIRDQFLFFSWSVRTPEARARMQTKFNTPDADFLHEEALEILRTGIHESDGYGAAFRCDGAAILKGITGLCLVTAQANDLLYEHLDRLPNDLPENVSVERFETPDALNAAAKQLLAEYAEGDASPVTTTVTMTDHVWKSYANTGSGQLFMRRGHRGSGLPVVLIHNLGSSSARWHPVMKALLGKRPFVAFDLPGHGETGNAWKGEDVTVDACAQAIDEAMHSLGLDACHVFSYGGGGLIALNVIERTKADVRSWTAIDFWLFDDEEKATLKDRLAPPLTPQQYGQHLNEAWYMIRDGELFWPWFEPNAGNAIDQPPQSDPAVLHKRVVDVLKASPAYHTVVNSALALDADAMLKSLDIQVTFGPRDGSPHTARCHRAAEMTPKGKAITLSNDGARRAAAAIALLRD